MSGVAGVACRSTWWAGWPWARLGRGGTLGLSQTPPAQFWGAQRVSGPWDEQDPALAQHCDWTGSSSRAGKPRGRPRRRAQVTVSPHSWIIGAAVVNAFYSPNRNQIGKLAPSLPPAPRPGSPPSPGHGPTSLSPLGAVVLVRGCRDGP